MNKKDKDRLYTKITVTTKRRLDIVIFRLIGTILLILPSMYYEVFFSKNIFLGIFMCIVGFYLLIIRK